MLCLIIFVLFLTSCKSAVNGTYEGKARGHNGDVVLNVSFENSKIKNVSLKESVETEDVGKLAIEKLIQKVNSGDFNLDEITGATYSSKAFVNALADAIKKSGLDYKKILKNNPVMNEKFEVKEMNTDVVIKATKVDGVYDKDPVKYPDAIKYETVSYTEVLNKDLKVMDATAISLCRENKLPIVVFNSLVPGNLKKVILGEKIGTTVVAE